MRDIQEIFNVVIDADHYHLYGLMCPGLSEAHEYGIITKEERNLAAAEIHQYLCDLAEEEDYFSDHVHANLVDALRSAGFAFSFEDRLAIYQKWADRPLPHRQGSIPMKSVQEIFDIVINHGYYKSHFEIRRTSPYMCVALYAAALGGVITESEERKAYLAIYEYLDPTWCVSLEDALQQSDLPNSFTRRLHLYRNWADRPNLRGIDNGNSSP